jgi:hypothetical protein
VKKKPYQKEKIFLENLKTLIQHLEILKYLILSIIRYILCISVYEIGPTKYWLYYITIRICFFGFFIYYLIFNFFLIIYKNFN